MTPQRTGDEDDFEDARELVRASSPVVGTPDVIAGLIDQSNREAAATRAQARELIKALDGVQRSQEYLGVALREERRRSRWLVALLVVAPIVAAAVAAAGAWFVWRHVDEAQSDLKGRVDMLIDDQRTAREQDAARQRDGRVAELTGDIESLRRDLDASRDALAAERKQVADREAALVAAQSRGDSARGEIGVFEFELKSAKATASAEAARAAQLETKIQELQADLDAKSSPPQPVASVDPSAPPPSLIAPPSLLAEAPPAALKLPDAVAAAVTTAAAVPMQPEQARSVLNSLLKDSAGDAVRYEFHLLGEVKGQALLNVLVVGVDEQGRVVRSIQAGRAEIAVEVATGSVVIHFFDGKLIVAGRHAPFFDGSYGLVVRGDASRWRAAAASVFGTGAH